MVDIHEIISLMCLLFVRLEWRTDREVRRRADRFIQRYREFPVDYLRFESFETELFETPNGVEYRDQVRTADCVSGKTRVDYLFAAGDQRRFVLRYETGVGTQSDKQSIDTSGDFSLSRFEIPLTSFDHSRGVSDACASRSVHL
jgi:hypothetical protein